MERSVSRRNTDLASKLHATSGSPPPSSSSTAKEKIPVMTNIAPSIFVPLEIDMTQPIEPAHDRVEKLERKLAAVEARRRGVTESMIYMASREMQRIRQEGREAEANNGPDPRPAFSMSDAQVDQMMERIAAPCHGRNLNITELPSHPVMLHPPGTLPLREAVATDLLLTLTRTGPDLEGYAGLAEGEKARLVAMQEREQQRLDNIGKRPGDRDVEMTGM